MNILAECSYIFSFLYEQNAVLEGHFRFLYEQNDALHKEYKGFV